MARPFARPSRIFHIKVPRDLADQVRGRRVTLPVGDAMVSVVATDKVALSLRTRDPAVAKERHAKAHEALLRHWAALRAGPIPLPHEQIAALAGEIYSARVAHAEADLRLDPDYLEAKSREWADFIDGLRAECAPHELDHLPTAAEAKDYVLLDLAHGDTRHAEQF